MVDDNRNRDPVDEGTLEEMYLPRLHSGPRLAHYYGDNIRMLFLVSAMAIFISIPLLDAFTILLPFQIVGALVLIGLAALTNPKNKMIMIGNAIAAALGIVMYETSALRSYNNDEMLAFALYEALAFLFIFALYFSLKTVRAMELRQIGRRDVPGEFMEERYKESKSMKGG